jgi:hypothetical protein
MLVMDEAKNARALAIKIYDAAPFMDKNRARRDNAKFLPHTAFASWHTR